MNYALPLANPKNKNLRIEEISLERGPSGEIDVASDVTSKLTSTLRSHARELYFAAFLIFTIHFAHLQHSSFLYPSLGWIKDLGGYLISSVLFSVHMVLWLRILRRQRAEFALNQDAKDFGIRFALAEIPRLIVTTVFGSVTAFAYAHMDSISATVVSLLALFSSTYVMLGLLFTPLLIADKNLSVIEAVRGSWMLADGRRAEIFSGLLVVSIIGVLSIVPVSLLGSALLFVVPAEAWEYVQSLLLAIMPFVAFPFFSGLIATFYERFAVAGNAYKHEALPIDDVQI